MSNLSYTEALAKMEPYLLSAGAKGKQIERAKGAQEVETHLWIWNIYNNEFAEAYALHNRHPREVWARLEAMGGIKFEEIRQYRLAMKKLRIAWFSNRPYEISKKAGTRRSKKENNNVSEVEEVGIEEGAEVTE